MKLADFEVRALRFTTQFFAEVRNANMDNPETNPLDRPESEWVSAFIGWLMLVPPFEEPTAIPVPIQEPDADPPGEGEDDEDSP